MNSASPTTSASTNRGGRPRDWTEQRARRLVRLYVYTKLPFDLILKLLEDGVWVPGYDAANKIKNQLLGNDPRWIRPKDEDDEKRRITGLKSSRRPKVHHRTSGSHPTRDRHHDGDSLTLAQSRQPSFEKSHPVTPLEQDTFNLGFGTASNSTDIGYDNYDTYLQYPQPPWLAGGVNASRQGTDLTNSTGTSMSSSFVEKLSTVSRDQAKGAWRVLKQFTFPKDSDLQRGTPFSPMLSPDSHLQPTHMELRDPDTSWASSGSSSAQYALPGDFLDTRSVAGRGLCEIGSISHESNTCWCRITNELSAPGMRPIGWNNITVYNLPPEGVYTGLDRFGNTVFHHLAATSEDHRAFFTLILQALGDPRLPVRSTNTAGQTFLHVLHPSWFDQEFLDQFLTMLKNANFDILATDVYGRSFFHLLQNKKKGAARIPPHLFDWNLLRRRDAFGVKPMDTRSRHLDPAAAIPMRPFVSSNPNTPPRIDIPSDHRDDARIQPQTDLLRIVIDAVKVDDLNSTNPNPRSEDSHGRNALHCLAEVELDADRIQHLTGDNQRQKKRKFKEEEGELPRPESSNNSKRLDFLEGILAANVDVNHYDDRGETPLMAFIKYRPEDSRSDKENMERIIRRLYNAGAHLEKRNRKGETALHVAARSGKKVALKELLQLRANPYVRDACGLSVLAAIDERWANTEGDGVLTAHLEACRGVFTSGVQDPAQEPTVLQEWGLRNP
ncbi:hypothetical protein M426DRAFT_321104 [Hypoxylon sp. CI-4A]|nr:hypothetical protein M426DRAFT_321104 [Hypoxylon sp. CI-4A]